MSDSDSSTARSEEPALQGPESGSSKPRNCEARSPDDSSSRSAPCAELKPLAIDIELYGRWTGEERGEVF